MCFCRHGWCRRQARGRGRVDDAHCHEQRGRLVPGRPMVATGTVGRRAQTATPTTPTAALATVAMLPPVPFARPPSPPPAAWWQRRWRWPLPPTRRPPRATRSRRAAWPLPPRPPANLVAAAAALLGVRFSAAVDGLAAAALTATAAAAAAAPVGGGGSVGGASGARRGGRGGTPSRVRAGMAATDWAAAGRAVVAVAPATRAALLGRGGVGGTSKTLCDRSTQAWLVCSTPSHEVGRAGEAGGDRVGVRRGRALEWSEWVAEVVGLAVWRQVLMPGQVGNKQEVRLRDTRIRWVPTGPDSQDDHTMRRAIATDAPRQGKSCRAGGGRRRDRRRRSRRKPYRGEHLLRPRASSPGPQLAPSLHQCDNRGTTPGEQQAADR